MKDNALEVAGGDTSEGWWPNPVQDVAIVHVQLNCGYFHNRQPTGAAAVTDIDKLTVQRIYSISREFPLCVERLQLENMKTARTDS